MRHHEAIEIKTLAYKKKGGKSIVFDLTWWGQGTIYALMADKSDKWKENKPGRFYVDQSCISCDACVCAAPENFSMNEEDGHAYVIKQPTTPAEEEACQEAIDGCPVGAIGNDGESESDTENESKENQINY